MSMNNVVGEAFARVTAALMRLQNATANVTTAQRAATDAAAAFNSASRDFDTLCETIRATAPRGTHWNPHTIESVTNDFDSAWVAIMSMATGGGIAEHGEALRRAFEATARLHEPMPYTQSATTCRNYAGVKCTHPESCSENGCNAIERGVMAFDRAGPPRFDKAVLMSDMDFTDPMQFDSGKL
jgi:hypothetical protein